MAPISSSLSLVQTSTLLKPTLVQNLPVASPSLTQSAAFLASASTSLQGLPTVSPGLLQAIQGLQPAGAPAASGSPKINLLGIKSTNLTTATGTPDNKSRVSIPFSSAIQVADPTKFTIQGAAIDPSTNTLVAKNIPVLDAIIDPQNPKNLLLTTGVILPTGAAITVGEGALKDAAGNPVPRQVTISPSGNGINHFSTANHFAPKDVNMFGVDAFSNATLAPIPAGNGPDEATAKTQLSGFLDKKVAAGQIDATRKAQLLNQYSADGTKTIIPNPNLRASLFSLAGGVSDGAINAVLTGANQSGKPFAKVDFDPSIAPATAVSNSLPDGSRQILFNPNTKAESFLNIAPVMAHEVMHQDNANGVQEEVVAQSANAFTYSQILKLDPNVAKLKTPLAQGNNTLLLAMLNSGSGAFPTPGIRNSPGVQINKNTPANSKVFFGPTGSADQSFLGYTAGSYLGIGVPVADTAGNKYLDSFMSAVTKSTISNSNFSSATYNLEDSQQKVIGVNDIFGSNGLGKALNLTLA